MIKNEYQNKIIKAIFEKKIISLSRLIEILPNIPKKSLIRSLRNCLKNKIIESFEIGNEKYFRLSKDGKKKIIYSSIDKSSTYLLSGWDGRWRIIILSFNQEQKKEKDAFRYLLQKAGFVCLRKHFWISPFPFEHFFLSLKNDFKLKDEVTIIVGDIFF